MYSGRLQTLARRAGSSGQRSVAYRRVEIVVFCSNGIAIASVMPIIGVMKQRIIVSLKLTYLLLLKRSGSIKMK